MNLQPLSFIEKKVQVLCGVIFKLTVGGNECEFFSNAVGYDRVIERVVMPVRNIDNRKSFSMLFAKGKYFDVEIFLYGVM